MAYQTYLEALERRSACKCDGGDGAEGARRRMIRSLIGVPSDYEALGSEALGSA